MIDLDDLELMKRADPGQMLRHIEDLPQQCAEASLSMGGLELPEEYRDIDNLVIAGMGGSAIGGSLLASLVERECSLPVIVHRDYGLPAFVGPRSLVIVSSYSGNTEEALSAFAEALEREAKVLAITSGGQLAGEARGKGIPLFTISYVSPPRGALGHSFIPLVGVIERLGFIADKSADLSEAIAEMKALQERINERMPVAKNPAKGLAQRLHGKMVVVYGAGHLTEVARRWKTQLNENGKAWGFFEALPELNHNFLEGNRFPAEVAEGMVVVALSSSLYSPRMRLRLEVTQEVLAQQGVHCERVEALGRNALAQMLSTIHLGDYTSFYLAMLYGIDPSLIANINYLKEQLAMSDNQI